MSFRNPFPIRPDAAEVTARLEDWREECGSEALTYAWRQLILPGINAHEQMSALVEMAFRAGYLRGLNAPPRPIGDILLELAERDAKLMEEYRKTGKLPDDVPKPPRGSPPAGVEGGGLPDAS